MRIYLGASAVFLLLAVAAGWEASKLGYYSSLGPGAGFFPLWLSLGLGLLALAIGYRASRGEFVPPEDFWPPAAGARRVAAVVLALAFTALAMSTLGFRLTMAATSLFLVVAMGCRKPVEIVLVVLLASVGAHLLFSDYLGVVLPPGRFGL